MDQQINKSVNQLF